MTNATSFKHCALCNTVWRSREEFVCDVFLSVNGYQASFDRPENGLFLLTHEHESCHSTLGIRAGVFKEYYFGPEYIHNRMGMEGCPLYCTDETKLDPCDNDCSMAWVRNILQYLRMHKLPKPPVDAA